MKRTNSLIVVGEGKQAVHGGEGANRMLMEGGGQIGCYGRGGEANRLLMEGGGGKQAVGGGRKTGC